MNHSRFALLLVAILPFGLTGCGGSSGAPTGEPSAVATLTVPSARYTPRTDLIVLNIPEGAPTRWYTPGYPPTRSARLFPNTPDRDLALELRKQFGKNVLDPLRFDPDLWMPSQADRVTRLVDAHFGTPAAPTVRVTDWGTLVATATVRVEPDDSFGKIMKNAQKQLKSLEYDALNQDWAAANAAKIELKLDDATLARGSVVYRRWCMQCHGPSGAGEVSHAVENGPMPRDYRQGVFKYTTAFPPTNIKKKGRGAVGKARRTDLLRVVYNGIDGTIMPAFPTLTNAELEDVVSYVIHLSIRGETELTAMAKMIKPDETDPIFTGLEIDWLLMKSELNVLVNWRLAEKNPIPIPPEPFTSEPERLKSAVRGFKLYNSAEFGCGSCHANYGRAPQLKWDAWGTIVQPRNFLPGVYRGGHRGEDLYARIYGGIGPSGMTAFHDRVTTASPGTPDKIWDIVHFLQALSDARDRKRMQEEDSEVKIE
jgi:mono/diheme cytochrome c family protein